MLSRLLACTLPLLAVAVASGCAAPLPPPAEEVGESDDALGSSTCEMLDESADRTLQVTLVLGAATVGCEAAVLVTTAGTASPACLVPAAGTAASWIVSALTRGVHTLLCARGREVSVELDTRPATETETGEATCEGGETRTCSDTVHRDLAERKGNACNVPRKCLGTMGCDEVQERIRRNSECLTARRRVTDVCCGGVDGPIHEKAREDVEATLDACQALLARACR